MRISTASFLSLSPTTKSDSEKFACLSYQVPSSDVGNLHVFGIETCLSKIVLPIFIEDKEPSETNFWDMAFDVDGNEIKNFILRIPKKSIRA
ncbi:hypothetical protein BBP40_009347 [Aspergillus hancockii]|nr:hypothetical protein BBP40_009347 [Aspergillus hancockii]